MHDITHSNGDARNGPALSLGTVRNWNWLFLTTQKILVPKCLAQPSIFFLGRREKVFWRKKKAKRLPFHSVPPIFRKIQWRVPRCLTLSVLQNKTQSADFGSRGNFWQASLLHGRYLFYTEIRYKVYQCPPWEWRISSLLRNYIFNSYTKSLKTT